MAAAGALRKKKVPLKNLWVLKAQYSTLKGWAQFEMPSAAFGRVQIKLNRKGAEDAEETQSDRAWTKTGMGVDCHGLIPCPIRQ